MIIATRFFKLTVWSYKSNTSPGNNHNRNQPLYPNPQLHPSSSSKGRAPFKTRRGSFRKFPNFQKREVQQVESPNQDVDNNICFACGKKGHWKKDCQKMKRVTQLRGLYEQLNDEEKELMEQDF